MRNIIKVAIAAGSIVAANPASAQNLVANGDFEAGNSGFTSSYDFSPGNGVPAAVYSVENNPQAWNSAFVTAGDHTSGSGLMFLANGAPTAGAIVWQSSAIPLSAMTNYFFEAFVMNVFSSNPPSLTFTVSLDGGAEMVLNTLGVPSTTGIWNGLSTTFDSGAATSASLYLRNAQTANFGNDFAIDDVYLGTISIVNPPMGAVPEPSTWALFILGFGLMGARLRSRRGLPRLQAA